MRLQGVGWGQVAHTLGVPPSRIGLGHQPSQGKIDTFRASHGRERRARPEALAAAAPVPADRAGAGPSPRLSG